jgi:hypothetical protein
MQDTYLPPSESTIRVYAHHICKHIPLVKNEPALPRQDIDEFTNYLQFIFNIHAKHLNSPKNQTARSLS